MISIRPYLLNAAREWISANGLTSHILVDATVEGVVVPEQYVREGKIVLNISPSAVRDLTVDNDCLFFNARFAGAFRAIEIPLAALLAIYARENGRGVVFPEEENTPEEDAGATPRPDKLPPAARPHLKIVK